MTPYDQSAAACRCEWGVSGLGALAPADVVVVVDVLSFSTCVDVATGRGAAILPFPGNDASAEAFALRHRAELAGRRDERRHSLSPASFLEAPAGLRCILPSPNGAALAHAAAGSAKVVLAGCLRNAAAVAGLARRLGQTFNVCPAGERWPDGSLRPAIEDWLAAGAILSRLPGTKSPEAAAAVAAFEAARPRLAEVGRQSSSGRELIERGFARDVELAFALDASAHAPRLENLAFVRQTLEPTFEERSVARLVLLDANRRVLLFRHADAYGREFWATPGGGLEPGETAEQAARREAAEELGAESVQLVPLWRGHSDFLFADRRVSQDETFFLVTSHSGILGPGVAETHRAEHIVETRWWTLDEIERSPETIFPADLPDQLRERRREWGQPS